MSELVHECLDNARTLHHWVLEDGLQLFVLRVPRRRDVLGREHRGALMAEAVVLLEHDNIRADVFGHPYEGGHLAEISALNDECEHETDGILSVKKEIAADRLHAAGEAVSQELAGLGHLADH